MDLENRAGWIAQARMALHLHPPGIAYLGQFTPYILTLEKETNGRWAHETLCIAGQGGQRSAGSRRHDIEGRARHVLNAAVQDTDPGAQPRVGLGKEAALLGGRFDERHAQLGPQRCQNDAWQAGTASEIYECLCCWRYETRQLGAVEDVSPPNVPERSRRNEVVATAPFCEQRNKHFETLKCFT